MIDTITEYYERHNANLYRAVYELAEEATAMFEGARTTLARVHRRAGSLDGRVHPRHHRVDQPRRQRLGPEVPPRGRRDPVHRDGAPLEHRPLAARRRGDRRGHSGSSRSRTTGRSTRRRSRRCITDRTKVLAITGQSNVLGTMPALERLTDVRARRRRDRRGRRRAARPAQPGGRRRARRRLPHDLGPQDARPDGVGRSVRPARAARRDGSVPRRRRDDHGGLSRPLDLQGAPAQVRGRDDEHRRGDRSRPRRSSTSRRSAWRTSGTTSGS